MNTTQTIHWMNRLAVTITAGGFCICAHAADITVNIAPAVHLSWPTTTNRAYQVQVSTNLPISTNLPSNWTSTGGLMEGTGGTLGVFLAATNGQRFFRIQETTASGLSWLDGTWTGQTFLTPPLEEYTVDLVADATNRIFSTMLRFSSGPPCRATLRLSSYSDNKAEFRELFASGSGCTDDTVVFTRLTSTTIAYTFFQTPSLQTGAGLLTKQ